jgi:Raf kinase inhibitor-like YbhB/YbcL family protein
MKRTLICLASLASALAACGDDSSSSGAKSPDASTSAPTDGTPTTDAPSTSTMFALTSTDFANNGAFPAADACAKQGNTVTSIGTSPPLAWTGVPTAALSLALVMTDEDTQPKLLHWVIYDIPTTDHQLPGAVDNNFMSTKVTGAQQTHSEATQQPFGYSGPCPPALHHYQLALYPLDTASLPDGASTTTAQEALVAITMHKLGDPALLNGTFTP